MRLIASILLFTCLYSSKYYSQTNNLEIDPLKEKQFSPYMVWRHQTLEGLAEFKKNHPKEYAKELWYYSSSFYIRRNVHTEGASIDVSMIAIDRFENQRKENEEALIEMPGFKDVLILLPANQLLYKP